MTRTTTHIYGPVSLSKDDKSKDNITGEILKKLGFAFGIENLNSKLGKLLNVLIQDAITYISNEYPTVPDGAYVEVISNRLLKIEAKEKLQRIVDTYHDSQQEMLKEMSNSKVADRWARIQEMEKDNDAEDDNEEDENEDQLEDFDNDGLDNAEEIEDEEDLNPISEVMVEKVVEPEIEEIPLLNAPSIPLSLTLDTADLTKKKRK